MYGIELAHQTRLFFMAVGIGFFAGAVFDIFRILRLAVNFGKIAVAIQDVIYILLFCPLFRFSALQEHGRNQNVRRSGRSFSALLSTTLLSAALFTALGIG